MPSGPKRILTPLTRCDRSSAVCSSATAATSGLKALICSSSRSTFFPATRATALNCELFLEMTSSVLRPIEPVDPRIVIRFILTIIQKGEVFYPYRGLSYQITFSIIQHQ